MQAKGSETEQESLRVLRDRYGDYFAYQTTQGYVTEISLQAGILRVPQEIEAFARLKSLDLSYNNLKYLPDWIGRLVNLSELRLVGNQLEDMPPFICNLSSMRVLDFTANRLRSIPEWVGHLSSLTELEVRANLLPDPFPDLTSRGPRACLQYVRSLIDGDPQYEARLLLVGDGGVGKSCLVAALRGDPFILNRPTTHGIELGVLPLSRPGASDVVVLNTWDFGGQEEYLTSHQFFYSKRSLYIVAWHPRLKSQEDGIEPWLVRLRLRLGDEARVIVVATHAGERPAELDLPGLMSKFGGMIAGFYRVESSSANLPESGILELRAALLEEAIKLPQMGQRFSRRWAAVRDGLSRKCQEGVMHITRSQYDDIASSSGLTPQAAQTLIDLLHDLGRVIHFSDDDGLRELVILNPEWLSKAVALVLADEEIRASGGRLPHRRFRHIWHDHGRENEPSYLPVYYPYFHRLMERFDICYRDKGEEWSLVGQRVPFDRPSDVPLLSSSPQLALVYEMREEPPGLMSWLIVRNQRFSTGRHWRYGVYLEKDGHGARLEFDRRSRRLTVEVSGSFPIYFLSLLRDGVDEVLKRWPGLHYERLIPCPQAGLSGVKCEGFLPEDTVLKAQEGKIKSLHCHRCLARTSISQLLTGYGVTEDSLLNCVKEIRADQVRNTVKIAQVLHYQRRTLRAVSSENSDGPRLFSFVPKGAEDLSWFERHDPRKFGSHAYEFTLWCDCPDLPHPVKKYEMSLTADWLRKLCPYAKQVAQILKNFAPFWPADQEVLKDQGEAMDRLASLFLEEHNIPRKKGGLVVAEGAGLRELHSMLKQVDPVAAWGGLRRVMTNEGDYLWLCEKHYHGYNPPLVQLISE